LYRSWQIRRCDELDDQATTRRKCDPVLHLRNKSATSDKGHRLSNLFVSHVAFTPPSLSLRWFSFVQQPQIRGASKWRSAQLSFITIVNWWKTCTCSSQESSGDRARHFFATHINYDESKYKMHRFRVPPHTGALLAAKPRLL
jgi:hypothetical protein